MEAVVSFLIVAAVMVGAIHIGLLIPTWLFKRTRSWKGVGAVRTAIAVISMMAVLPALLWMDDPSFWRYAGFFAALGCLVGIWMVINAYR